MKPVLQSRLPISPWADPQLSRLPGVQPLDPEEWLIVDDAFAGQMAERGRLLNERRNDVLKLNKGAIPAAQETLSLVLNNLEKASGYKVGSEQVLRPDGKSVRIDMNDPFGTLGHLVQEDICIMQDIAGEHVLTGAILCFPASWTLAEKFMRPLIGIHEVVKPYDENIARRVQRLFDAIRTDRPMWRANAHFYNDPALYSPQLENALRTRVQHPALFVRSERQSMIRLAKSNAVIFSIHTYIVRQQDLTQEQAASIGSYLPNQKMDF